MWWWPTDQPELNEILKKLELTENLSYEFIIPPAVSIVISKFLFYADLIYGHSIG